MRNNIGWNGWSSGYTYTVYSDTTNIVIPRKIPQVYEKTKYEIWVEALGKLLEEGFEIDIVTGGVINA